MTGTKYRGWVVLLTAALPAFTGCVMEPDVEPGEDRSELAGAESLPPVDPCNSSFVGDPERTIALPLVMHKTGISSRLLVDTGWYTNALIQNTSTSLATVRLRAISTEGVESCNVFSLGAGTAVNFRPDNKVAPGTVGIPTLPAGSFEGSMLIESDRRLAVAAKLTNIPLELMGRAGGTAAAAYQGLPLKTGSAEIGQELAYSIMKSGFNVRSTTLFVQNVESWTDRTDPLHVEVRTNDNKVYTYSTHVRGRRSVAIHPGDLTRIDENGVRVAMPAACTGGANADSPGAPCFGSVRIVPYRGFARFAAIAVEHAASGTTSAVQAAHFEEVRTAPHRQWIPVVKNQYQGASSGIGIMNASGAYQDVTLILRPRAMPWIQYSYTFEDVPPYRSVVASPSAGTFAGFPAGEIGTAEIQSTGAVVAAVNETDSSGWMSSSGGRPVPGDLAAPLIKADWFGRKTRTTLWNVGDQPVQILGTYRCHTEMSGTYSVHTHTMVVDPKVAVDFEPTNIPAGNLCSAIFTTAQRTLVGVVAEESLISPPPIDGSIYEAILLD